MLFSYEQQKLNLNTPITITHYSIWATLQMTQMTTQQYANQHLAMIEGIRLWIIDQSSPSNIQAATLAGMYMTCMSEGDN